MIRDLILGHVSHGSTLESFLSESIVHRAKDQQRNMGMVLVESAEQAVACLSSKVYQYGIRPADSNPVDRVHLIRGAINNMYVRSPAKNLPKPMADNRIVCHDQKANGARMGRVG
jgi:hypothetical protein